MRKKQTLSLPEKNSPLLSQTLGFGVGVGHDASGHGGCAGGGGHGGAKERSFLKHPSDKVLFEH